MGWVAFNGRLGGEARPKNTDGIAPLLDKGWVRGTDILDENKIILCDKIGVFPNSKESKEAAAETEDETTKVSVQSEEKPQ